jgi:putative selenium metabolism hydrolase
MTNAAEKLSEINRRVEENRPAILRFLKEIIAIPSMDSQIRAVGERIAEEMTRLGFRHVWFDRQGNIVGEIGTGGKKLLYDSHIDTVGIGNIDEWEWDPFEGKEENGIFYARGACDEKGSTPGMVYGLAIAHELGLLEGYTAYYFGNMEEWDDGVAPQVLVEHEGIRPDFVVIGEPTRMQVYRGHKGRVEMKVTAKGKSAHAASNFLGDNPIYKLVNIINFIRDMQPQMGNDSFLGVGRITVTDMHIDTPSINAVPAQATLYIDRRMTFGETWERCLEQIHVLTGADDRDDITVEILRDGISSYTGFKLVRDKIYPAWAMPEGDAYVQAGLDTVKVLWGGEPVTGKWEFSTNGTYWNGIAGIPSIGFGPGDEVHAHTVLDQVPLEDVVRSTAFYALFPGMITRAYYAPTSR